MKPLCRLALLMVTGFGLMFLTASPARAQQKLLLEPDMIYNFSTRSDGGMLVDEQALAGDPAAGLGGSPVTVFSPGWINASIYFPAMVVVDLQRVHVLNSLWLYDVNDSDTLFIFTGDPSSWQARDTMLLNQYNTWREIVLGDTTRFVMFCYRSPATRVAEIVLYGTPAGPADPPPAPVPVPRPLMQQFMGVNGFFDDPVARLNCVGSVREYHNWGWDEGNLDTTYQGYPNNQYGWNPSWICGPGWAIDFDGVYQQWQNNALNFSPDLQGCAPYLTGFNDSLTQHKPVRAGEDPLDPSAYVEHADYLYQFAARYGRSVSDTALLKLKPGNAPITGSGRIRYLENWNEPDKTWFTRGGYFTPDEFATMCSADCDGHNNTLGPGKGMKNADPSIKMVMAGLTELNLEYIRCMKLWSDWNRTSGFPADVLNFHHYCGNGQHGISPEQDSLKRRLQQIVAFRDSCMPGKEIWLSEFGYDTNPLSEQAAVAIGGSDIYEVQGQWILRSYLEAAAAGIDRAFVFMLRDANAGDPNKYNSSGLTGEIWYGHQPKKSWFYVSAMTRQLTGLRFDTVLSSGHDSVSVCRFVSSTGDKTVYAVWCRSSSNLAVLGFSLAVAPSTAVFVTKPQAGLPDGISSVLYPTAGTVTFTVTELPVFIRTVVVDSLPPLQINLNEIRLEDGESGCYDAVQEILVAGNGGWFEVDAGASTELVSGFRIGIRDGARVEAGGYLKARIPGDGAYCPDTANRVNGPQVAHVAGHLQQGGCEHHLKLYPNPTKGRFILDIGPVDDSKGVVLSVTGSKGEELFTREVQPARQISISLEGRAAGIYHVRLIAGETTQSARICLLD